MSYCPYFNQECYQDISCAMWDTDYSKCGIIVQKNVMQQILATGGETSVLSLPPTGMYKITNAYYDYSTDEQVIIREDNPA